MDKREISVGLFVSWHPPLICVAVMFCCLQIAATSSGGGDPVQLAPPVVNAHRKVEIPERNHETLGYNPLNTRLGRR